MLQSKNFLKSLAISIWSGATRRTHLERGTEAVVRFVCHEVGDLDLDAFHLCNTQSCYLNTGWTIQPVCYNASKVTIVCSNACKVRIVSPCHFNNWNRDNWSLALCIRIPKRISWQGASYSPGTCTHRAIDCQKAQDIMHYSIKGVSLHSHTRAGVTAKMAHLLTLRADDYDRMVLPALLGAANGSGTDWNNRI